MLRTNRLGEKKINNQGDEMEIVKYISSHNCTIKFKTNEYIKTKVKYSDFSKGCVRNPWFPTIFEVGYIGNIKNPTNHKLYNIWINLIRRTHVDSCYNDKPTYEKCSLDEEWLCFERFVNDYPYLLGYRKNKKRFLDKDILSDEGLYSKDTCCLVSGHLNTFLAMVSRNNSIGRTGVHICDGLYVSQVRFEDIHMTETFRNLEAASIHYWRNKIILLENILQKEPEEIRMLAREKIGRIIKNEGLSIENLKEVYRVVGKTLDK